MQINYCVKYGYACHDLNAARREALALQSVSVRARIYKCKACGAYHVVKTRRQS